MITARQKISAELSTKLKKEQNEYGSKMPNLRPSSLNRVIVTDPHMEKYGLSVIRSLGRRGIYVTCLYQKDDFIKHGYSGGAVSKYCSKLLISEDLISDIIKLSENHSVLIPISTSTIDLVSKNIHRLREHINIPIPSFETIYKARNKELLLKHCMENCIPIPKTFFIHDVEEIEQIAQNIKFPAIIKFRDEMVSYYPRYTIVNCREELTREYRRMHIVQNLPLVQEYVKGKGVGFFALFSQDQQPRAIFCHERLRECPPTGGQSALCKSIYDEKLISYGSKILSTLGWYGVAMVEFKLDEDNEPRVMEVNPRFWGSLPLALFSGVDFPYLLYKIALEGDIEPVTSYKTNVKMRYLFLDMSALKKYILSKHPNKIRYIFEFIKDFFDRNTHEAIIAKDDLKPSVVCYFRILRNIITLPIKRILGWKK